MTSSHRRAAASVLVALTLTEAWVHNAPVRSLVPGRRHASAHGDGAGVNGVPSAPRAVSAMLAGRRRRATSPRAAAADGPADDGGELTDLAEVKSVESADQSALAQRLAGGFGPTVWSEFGSLGSELAEKSAAGECEWGDEHGLVNLGQGFPDFAPPDFVRMAAVEALSMDCHQYTRPAGHPPLVKVLAERYSHHLGREILPMEEVAVTVGCSQALYVTMQCLVRAGDEVVLLEPFFDLYIGQIRMAGGTPRYVPLKPTPGEKKGWALDVAALEEAMGPRTRVLVLNSPHNPTGKVFSEEEMAAVAAVVARYPQVTVVSDEVYKYTVHGGGEYEEDVMKQVVATPEMAAKMFDKLDVNKDGVLTKEEFTEATGEVVGVIGDHDEGADHGAAAAGLAAGGIAPPRHVHFASLPGMFDRTLTLSSAGKTFSVTGWQVGWIVGPKHLVRDIHVALPFLQFCASTPIQQAMTGVLSKADQPYGGEPTYYDWLCAQYRRKAALLSKALKGAGLPVLASEGGYFLTVDVSGVAVPQKYLDETSGAISTVTHDWAFCRWLAIEHGILSIPVAPFYSADRRASGDCGSYVRFAFCKTDETLQKAAERLNKLGDVLRGGSAPAESAESVEPKKAVVV